MECRIPDTTLVRNRQIHRAFRFQFLHRILYNILVGFKPCHHPSHSTVFIKFQDEIGFLSHDMSVEMFDKRVGTAAEIGNMKAESKRMILYKPSRPQDLGTQPPIHAWKVGKIHSSHIYEIHGHAVHANLGHILTQPEIVQRACSILLAPPPFISAFVSALVTLAVFEGAYIAEIVRAGIQSIDQGQWEAAHALGLSKWQQMRYVIFPQAVQRILPPLAGQFISLVKDSSIVSVISIQELTFQGMELMAVTYLTFEIWITITILYLVMTLTCSLAVQRLEVRMARGRI